MMWHAPFRGPRFCGVKDIFLQRSPAKEWHTSSAHILKQRFKGCKSRNKRSESFDEFISCFIATQDFGCDTSHSDCHLYRFCAVASGFELLGGGGQRQVGSWMDGGRRQIMFGGRSIGGNLEIARGILFPAKSTHRSFPPTPLCWREESVAMQWR